MIITQRSVNPAWEDPVTMAVNAGLRLLAGEDERRDRAAGGLGERPGIRRSRLAPGSALLGLPDGYRDLEIKHACYGGGGGARAGRELGAGPAHVAPRPWSSPPTKPRALSPSYEFVMGAGAAAMLVSQKPDFLELEPEYSGVFARRSPTSRDRPRG